MENKKWWVCCRRWCNAIGRTERRRRQRPLAEKLGERGRLHGYVGDVKIEYSKPPYAAGRSTHDQYYSITHDGQGQLLNQRRHHCRRTGIALTEQYQVNLYYCFEKPGVMTDIDDADSVIRYLDPELYATYREQTLLPKA